MDAKFIKWQLLELFDEEQIINKEEYKYSKNYSVGMILEFYIAPSKNVARILLRLKKNTPFIFDISLEAVSEVSLHKGNKTQSLRIERKNTTKQTFDQNNTILEITVDPFPFVNFSI